MQQSTTKGITVLLADDHRIVRAGLRILLQLEGDITIVGEADNGLQAVALTAKLLPDVVLMDIAMPILNGLEATRQILQVAPETKVLILSAHSDDAYVQQALALGAVGYVIKDTAAETLEAAIRRVHQGHAFFSPTISKRLRYLREKAHQRGEFDENQETPDLSPRETEVLRLIAKGNANKQMAEKLQVSIKTVEKHRKTLMVKLNIHDTAGLTRHAIAIGLIDETSSGGIDKRTSPLPPKR